MNFDLRFYLRLFLARLPWMMVIIIVCSALGVAVAMRAPVTFEADARMVVEAPQIPGNLASSTVRTNPRATIEVIRQRLLTRPNLLDIANEFDVFPDYSSTPPDQIVTRMRNATTIRSQGRGDPIFITVAFEARNGQIAANVVNEYVTRIISANVEFRTENAGETLQFFEQEVERLSTELELQGAQILQYQAENADALPSDQNFRMDRLSRLQERIVSAERELGLLENQRARLIEIFETTGEIATGGVQLTPEQRELQRLEQELSDALLIYSEENPRVQILQRRIDQSRQRLASSLDTAEDETAPTGASPLDIQLIQIDSQVADLETLVAEARAEARELESAIARTPGNAIVLRGLERDYDNVRRQYDAAVSRLAEASTGERIEVSARGERITVIESASVPRQPKETSASRTIAMGVAAGVGLAGGIFVLLELLNRSVRRPVEITGSLGITPLSTIPFLETPRRRVMRNTVRIASFVVILIGVPAALWAVDTYFMPLDRLASNVLARIGVI